MARIPEEIVSQLQSLPIKDVAMRLGAQFKGSKNMAKCILPDHKDNNPSFSVHPGKNIYKCFSCGSGGSPIKLVQETLSLSYREAMVELARMFSIAIPEEDGHENPKAKYLLLNKTVQDRAHEALLSDELALTYLMEVRGMGYASIKKYKLGLFNLSLVEDLDMGMMQELGLVKITDWVWSMFENRIMFPVHDIVGNVVGFSGRVFREQDKELPKYVNSIDSFVFDKSKCIFGLHANLKSIRKHRELILMEGPTDVIAADEAGLDYGGAILGTALTGKHAKAMRSSVDTLTLFLDNDRAGRAAITKSMGVTLPAGFETFVCSPPDGLDPAGMAKKGLKISEYMAKNKTKWYTFFLNLFDLFTGAQARIQIFDRFMEVLSFIDHPAIHDEAIRKWCDHTKSNFEMVQAHRMTLQKGNRADTDNSPAQGYRAEETSKEFILTALLVQGMKYEDLLALVNMKEITFSDTRLDAIRFRIEQNEPLNSMIDQDDFALLYSQLCTRDVDMSPEELHALGAAYHIEELIKRLALCKLALRQNPNDLDTKRKLIAFNQKLRTLREQKSN